MSTLISQVGDDIGHRQATVAKPAAVAPFRLSEASLRVAPRTHANKCCNGYKNTEWIHRTTRLQQTTGSMGQPVRQASERHMMKPGACLDAVNLQASNQADLQMNKLQDVNLDQARKF